MSRLLIAASGTGGHLFPALAVADALSPFLWKISWLGVPDRLETELVPEKYGLTTINVEGLHARGFKKVFQLFKLILATIEVVNLLQRKRIEVVFTTGGYIAAPTILAALWLRLPVILHESNALPGKVTRLLGRFCSVVALGMLPATKRLPHCKTIVTGTPIRASFFLPQALPEWVPSGAGPLIVVMGGSQGALGLNVMVRDIIPELLDKGCRFVHITGSNDSEAGVISHINFLEIPFTDEIPALLQNADLVISRSGAGALSELAASNTPAILVPYPWATDKHQDHNAAFAAELGAAVIVHQHVAGNLVLKKTLNRLLNSRFSKSALEWDPLPSMKEGMEALSKKEAVSSVIEILERFS